jgi:hypothetical protein
MTDPVPASRFVRLARACNRHRRLTVVGWLLALIVIQLVAANVGARQAWSPPSCPCSSRSSCC